MRNVLIAISALVCAAVLHAQAPQPQTAARTGDNCTIEGKVLNAVNGEPLKKATLLLIRTDGPRNSLQQAFTTSTDASGAFAMKDIEPGKYRLRANRSGFVASEYGARRSDENAPPLTLARASALKDIVIRLLPQGVVAGRILDDEGEPVPSASVQVLKLQYVSGRKQLKATAAATTNDIGEYRAAGLAPGRYYVSSALTLVESSVAIDRSARPQVEEESIVATYYPGTADPSMAAAVDVAAGTVVRGIDMRLAKTRTVRIRGRVNPPGATSLLIFAPKGLSGALSLRLVRLDQNGEFDLRGVSPGAYTLTGSLKQDGKTATASLPVEVGTANIDNLVFGLGGGVAVQGRIRVEGETKEDLSKLSVRLQAREMGLGSVLSALGSVLAGAMPGESTGKLEKDLTFRVEDVNADLYDVRVDGLPDGFYIKSVRSGDAEVLMSGLNIATSAPEPLDVVLSAKAGQISGSIANQTDRQRVLRPVVALVPRDAERLTDAASYRDATADENGSFTFKNLPPGKYKLYAWEDVEPGAWMDPDFMKPLDSLGAAVTLGESGRENVELRPIPASGGGR